MNQTNALKYKRIIFDGEQWQLFDAEHQEVVYNRHRVVIDLGLFFLLEFSNDTQRTTIVIFKDQLSKDDCRHLRLLELV